MTTQEIFDHWAAARLAGPKPGSVWRHYRGVLYVVEGITLRESDLEPLVSYTVFGSPVGWTRPLSEWRGWVECEGRTVQRFTPADSHGREE